MKNFLIVDANSPAHVGNGVLLASSINVIRRAFPDAAIRFLSMEMTTPALITGLSYDAFPFRFPVHASISRKVLWVMQEIAFIMMHIFNRCTFRFKPSTLCIRGYKKDAFRKIEEADIVVSITGEAINDRTRTTLPFYLFTYWLAISLGKKMVIFPQSIGPLSRSWTREMTAFVLKRCALVFGRDRYSMGELDGLGISQSIAQFSPDVGVIQPYVPLDEATRILESQEIRLSNKRLVGISVSRPKEEGIADINHIEVILKSIKQTLSPSDTHLLILPANMPVNDHDFGDLPECEAFAAALPEFHFDILAPRIYRPEEYKGILALLDLFITSRMHVSILSTMVGTPTITLNTQRKLHGYMSNIGQERYSLNLDNLSAESLSAAINNALAEREVIRESLRVSSEKMEREINTLALLLRQKFS